MCEHGGHVLVFENFSSLEYTNQQGLQKNNTLPTQHDTEFIFCTSVLLFVWISSAVKFMEVQKHEGTNVGICYSCCVVQLEKNVR